MFKLTFDTHAVILLNRVDVIILVQKLKAKIQCRKIFE